MESSKRWEFLETNGGSPSSHPLHQMATLLSMGEMNSACCVESRQTFDLPGPHGFSGPASSISIANTPASLNEYLTKSLTL